MNEGQRPFDLTGRTVVVTGAAGILGATFCSALTSAGARVIGVDLDGDAVMKKNGAGVIAIAADLSSEKSIGELVQKIFAEHGGADVLVNNAASKSSNLRAFFAPFEKFSADTWDEVMAVNVRAVMLLCREFGGRWLEAHRRGAVINIASVYGVVAPDARIYEGSEYPEMGGRISTPAVYSASKAAVIGLTRHLAAHWGEAGIRVNAISPGGIESGQNDVFQKNYSARVPMRRMAERDEMCGALLFLASDASSYVTGQNIVVDGGLTAW